MGCARNASGPEYRCLHCEVEAVFLDHQVRRGLGSPKQAVLGGIDAHAFRNAPRVIGMAFVDLPTGLEFGQGQIVRSAAVDLVRTTKYEGRLGAVSARAVQQEQGS